MTIDGEDYFFAAQPRRDAGVRPAAAEERRRSRSWTPFVEALLIAALAGGALAARRGVPARAPDRAARRSRRGRGAQPRARHASRAGARRRRRRARDARAARSTTSPTQLAQRARGGAELPALRQPRAEDAADRDPRLRRGARRTARSTPRGCGGDGRRSRRARLERLVARPARPRADEPHRLQRPHARDRPRARSPTTPCAATSRRPTRSASRSSRASDGAAPAIADADRVLQVVSNLVENALRLDAGAAARCASSPRRALLRVEDTGPGLEPEEHERAFERFYLHERYGRERPVGTGLGLAIVKELTEAMGGTVEVESDPGGLTDVHRAARRARAPARTQRRSLRAMVSLDDVERARASSPGASTARRCSLRDALRAARRRRPSRRSSSSGRARSRCAARSTALSALTRRGAARAASITISAGNHAQAVAWAAREEGVDCLVVMWQGASPLKVEATRGYGATVDHSAARSDDGVRPRARRSLERDGARRRPSVQRPGSSSPATARSRSRSSRTCPTLDVVRRPASAAAASSRGSRPR